MPGTHGIRARYITTTLPYVNADPHIGFAYELLQADALARAWRLRGDDVFFATGTDEHGQKIAEAAAKAGESVHAYVDRYAAEFRKLNRALDLDPALHFIRTTDERHIRAAQELWERCEANGDIEKRSFTGLYCIGCEAFKTPHEIDASGCCILHPHIKPEEVSEENYFFVLSRYERDLKDYLQRADSVVPNWRRLEALAFVEAGLEDISISREKSRISWGIPVPGDESQVMYVWFDALANYISVLGWPDERGDFKKYWQDGTTLQIAGKDQVRFQSILWQAMLMSANIQRTDTVFYHGFINSGGQKMSKSVGNVISPYELVAKYGTEATRYLLLRHIHPTEDTDVTWERLDEWYTANLVNGLGNLVARVMKLSEQYMSEPVEIPERYAFTSPAYLHDIDTFNFNVQLDAVFQSIANTDLQMTSQEPFKKVKAVETEEEARATISKLVCELSKIAWDLKWAMPDTSKKIIDAIRENKKPENLFPRLA